MNGLSFTAVHKGANVEQGEVLRTARDAAGVGLREMARLVHYSPTYVSYLESGKRPVPERVVEAYERVLGVDLERLTSVAEAPRAVDRETLNQVGAMLSSVRRLEDTTGAKTVLPAVQGMATMAEALADQSRGLMTQPTAALASELSQYRGWLEHVAGAASISYRSLGRAITLGQRSEDADRQAQGLSFKGYICLADGDMSDAAGLTDAALDVRGMHPRLSTYVHYQRARILAQGGEPAAAQRALRRADREAAAAENEEPPEAGYWYTDGFWGLQRGRVLILLGHHEMGLREIVGGLADMPAEHRNAEWSADWVAIANGDTAP